MMGLFQLGWSGTKEAASALALMIPIQPPAASSISGEVDQLYYLLTGITLFFTVLIFSIIFYFMVKYRRRSKDEIPPEVHSSLVLELAWTIIPSLICVVIFVWASSLYIRSSRPPSASTEIFVIGKQWMWHLQHPEGPREINELHVPVGLPVKLTLTSEDAIHDFYVPDFRIKVDVLPNRYVHCWFQATKTGQYNFFCSQYCGTNHSGMIGQVTVMDPVAYREWLQTDAEGSLALEGRKLFLQYQCTACHSADQSARAPVLEGLSMQAVHLTNGRTVTADDNYLRESILDPSAKIVAGYEDIMPSFAGQLSEEEVIRLLAYIKSLSAGQTPKRIDQAPPPVAAPPGAKDKEGKSP
jgi:cytochrome c oxidase subunit II